MCSFRETMVSRLYKFNYEVSISLLFNFPLNFHKKISRVYGKELYQRGKVTIEDNINFIHFNPSFSNTIILKYEPLNIHITIPHIICLYILSRTNYCTQELIDLIEQTLFPIDQKIYKGFKRELNQLVAIDENQCYYNTLDYQLTVQKWQQIISDLLIQSKTLRDNYWNIKDKKIFVSCTQISNTIDLCTEYQYYLNSLQRELILCNLLNSNDNKKARC